MILNTERLLLRPLTMADTADIYAYASHEEVGPNAGWQPHANLAETQKIMLSVFLPQEHVFGLALPEQDKVIGTIGLLEDPKRQYQGARMLGYSLGRDYWGLGLMTEAAQRIIAYGFDNLQLKLISAYCYPHNQRSRRVLRKCGFTYEGSLRLCEELYNGEVYDNDCYILINPSL